MSFLISNPNGGTALSGISFTDTLPAGLTAPNGTTAQCGGSLVIAGTNNLSFTGGTLAAGANSSITVSGASTTFWVEDETIETISSTESGTGAPSNTTTVGVG